jgi:hypothetical protein
MNKDQVAGKIDQAVGKASEKVLVAKSWPTKGLSTRPKVR